jgi:hypothetical protein
MKYTKIINNKALCFLDAVLRKLNYYIEIQGVDLKTKEFDNIKIKHISQFKCH